MARTSGRARARGNADPGGPRMRSRVPAAVVAIVAFWIGGIAGTAHAQEEERAAQTYQIFKTHCFECHAERRKGGLDLRTDETLQKGGDSGKAVVPHDPSHSRLYLLASHADPDDVMPPKKP